MATSEDARGRDGGLSAAHTGSRRMRPPLPLTSDGWQLHEGGKLLRRWGAASEPAGQVSGCTKWFSLRSRAVLERWCTGLALAHREGARGLAVAPAKPSRRLAARPSRPASLSAASLVACPCVTNLTQLRPTSQSLTTMVVGYSLSFRPPPSSQTMTSSTRAP